MTAEEWVRIKDIFEAALSIPATDRDEYLRAASNDEPGIHETVVELLRNHQSVLESSSQRRINAAPVLDPDEMIAGRFRIIHFIAAGGMGEVYEAIV